MRVEEIRQGKPYEYLRVNSINQYEKLLNTKKHQ